MNSPVDIKKRFKIKDLSWWPIILFLPTRFLFAFITQGLAAGIFALQGSADPWHDAAAWWPVYSTLTDMLTLAALLWFVKYEGIRLVDLIGVKGKNIVSQLRFTPLFLFAVVPFAALASIVTRLFYGSAQPPMIEIVDLPIAAAMYSLVVWPVVWVIAEQLFYLGYLLPRLEVITGKTWLAGSIVALMWGVQHFAIPFIPDETYLLSRVLAATAATSGFTLVYILLKRRLVAAMGAHWIADVSTAFMAAILPLLAR